MAARNLSYLGPVAKLGNGQPRAAAMPLPAAAAVPFDPGNGRGPHRFLSDERKNALTLIAI